VPSWILKIRKYLVTSRTVMVGVHYCTRFHHYPFTVVEILYLALLKMTAICRLGFLKFELMNRF